MEGTYACNLNNRFELFLNCENDPLEILAKTEQSQRKNAEKKDNKKEAGKKKGLSKQLVESVKTIAAAVDSTAVKPLSRRNDGGPSAGPRTQSSAPPTTPGSGPTESTGPRSSAPPRNRDFSGPGGGGERNFERRNNERNVAGSGYAGGYGGEARHDGGDRPPREYHRGPNLRGGARGGGRGGFRGREFDRRSGDVRSGVKPVDKRGGQGSYNWGNAQADADQQAADHQAASAPAGLDNSINQEVRDSDNTNNDVPVEGEANIPAEPEVVEMTLEQWKKEQAAKRSKAEYAGTIRKPNEGEKDDPKLKKAVVIRKKVTEETDEESEDEAEESEDEGEKLKKQLEQTLASQFRFADQRGGFGGASRGRGRGTGGLRGGPGGDRTGGPGDFRGPRSSGPGGFSTPSGPRPSRSQQQQQHTPRVEDLNDFPSLAA